MSVQVNGDTVDEPDESFNVDLSSLTNATIADNRGVGTIIDDDFPTDPPENPPAPPIPEIGDTNPPETTIVKGPKAKTKKKKATFEFTSSEPGSSFLCTLDGRQEFKPCTSPLTVKVEKGKHTFQVQAIDQAGNVDPSPTTDTWKRKKKR